MFGKEIVKFPNNGSAFEEDCPYFEEDCPYFEEDCPYFEGENSLF